MASDTVQAVKDRINIVEVVRRYVDLRPVSGRWMGACPFHQETKPSFSVNEDEGFFYCFGCQAAGDVLDFYQRINGLEFKEALQQLADEAGVELTGYQSDPEAEARNKRKKLFLDMHQQAQTYFSRTLRQPPGAQARAYLERRGMTREIVEGFGLGASPDDWHGLDGYLQQMGHRPEDGVDAGLLSKNEKGNIYDRFRARLIFPIQNLAGKVIAFGGRIINEGEPKYLNSSDTPIYKKGEHLYGLHQARPFMNRTKRALLTEGYMDVLSLHQFGYQEACGVLGTALTSEQVRRLAGFCTRIDLVFDGDGAGRKAALKSSRMILLQGVSCRVVLLPDGKDVDDVLQQHGREGFEDCLDNSLTGLDFCLNTLRDEFSPREIMDWAVRFMGDLADPTLQAFYLPKLVAGLGLSEAEFRRSIPGAKAAPKTYDHSMQPPAQGAGAPGRGPLGQDDKHDEYFLKFPIQYPDYIQALDERGFGHILATEWGRELWDKMLAHPPQALLAQLGEREKRFWAKCRHARQQEILAGKELLAEWEHICSKIEAGQVKRTKREIIDAMRKAQAEGNQELVKKYQVELQAFIREER